MKTNETQSPELEESPLTTTKIILLAITALATVVCALFVVNLHKYGVPGGNVHANSQIRISLGAMGYSFSGNTAVKRAGGGMANLHDSLAIAAKKDIAGGCKAAYYSVAASSPDETQVFLKYGCTSPDSPMYAVEKAGAWQLLSPTNHFDVFDIPDCAYVAMHAISTAIAPVCNSGQATPQHYRVR